jgi:NADH-quinone oxidoreductase subunit L
VDGSVNAVGKGVVWGGRTLRLVQSGNIGFYIFIMVAGIIAIFVFNIRFK